MMVLLVALQLLSSANGLWALAVLGRSTKKPWRKNASPTGMPTLRSIIRVVGEERRRAWRPCRTLGGSGALSERLDKAVVMEGVFRCGEV
jgi:hypothetical protein